MHSIYITDIPSLELDSNLQSTHQSHSQYEKSAQRRCKNCALAVVWPRHRPLPRGMGQPKVNHLEMVTTITYKPTLVRIDARNFELSW